eukprot:m51a1_g7767 hypothetical protein (459) ;mRNA; r:143667-145043
MCQEARPGTAELPHAAGAFAVLTWETLMMVAELLDHRSCGRLARTCRTMRELLANPRLWADAELSTAAHVDSLRLFPSARHLRSLTVSEHGDGVLSALPAVLAATQGLVRYSGPVDPRVSAALCALPALSELVLVPSATCDAAAFNDCVRDVLRATLPRLAVLSLQPSPLLGYWVTEYLVALIESQGAMPPLRALDVPANESQLLALLRFLEQRDAQWPLLEDLNFRAELCPPGTALDVAQSIAGRFPNLRRADPRCTEVACCLALLCPRLEEVTGSYAFLDLPAAALLAGPPGCPPLSLRVLHIEAPMPEAAAVIRRCPGLRDVELAGACAEAVAVLAGLQHLEVLAVYYEEHCDWSPLAASSARLRELRASLGCWAVLAALPLCRHLAVYSCTLARERPVALETLRPLWGLERLREFDCELQTRWEPQCLEALELYAEANPHVVVRTGRAAGSPPE